MSRAVLASNFAASTTADGSPSGHRAALCSSQQIRDGARAGLTLRDTYRLLRPIGRGGMATVYEALHLRLGHSVAVKLMASSLDRDRRALARFRAEAELLVQLRHPHIVRVLDYDTTPDGEPYIVMERVEGEMLADRLDRDPRLSIAEVATIVEQLASALAHAHARGVLHRDLKPTNVMLDQPGGEGVHAMLLDFGIAKRLLVDAGITQDGMVGTPEYMAPEQAELGARIDHRADQYALGLCAYEMLSGFNPFWDGVDTDIVSVFRRVRAQDRPPLRRSALHVPPGVAEVVERAMSVLPHRRHPDVLAFARALRKAQRLAEQTCLAASDDPSLERLLVERLGGAGALIRRRAAREASPQSDLTPHDAFVLSRIDGPTTLEELVDICPLPRLEALRSAARLLERGLIGVA
jgi:eukaryotic-like serine/threonine-protein kinase